MKKARHATHHHNYLLALVSLSLSLSLALARAMALLTPPMFRLAIYGDPDEMVDRLRWLVGRGVTQINIGPPLGPDPERALRITGERVLARLR